MFLILCVWEIGSDQLIYSVANFPLKFKNHGNRKRIKQGQKPHQKPLI
jgi:hypothetical protein